MPYNNIISRTDAAAEIPEDVAKTVLGNVAVQSAAMQLFPHVQMSRAQQRIPVLSALPLAYWVNPSDTGLKQTTEVDWTNKYLNAEEAAAIIPVPDSVAADMAENVWDTAQPLLESAIARLFDQAVFFGVNKPASFPADIVTTAISAGNHVTRGTNAAAAGGIAGDISDLLSTMEADGFAADGFVANVTLKGRLRQARGTTGERFAEVSPLEIDGTKIIYPMRGLWPTGSGAAELIAADSSQGIVGIRQDITWKFLDQAVIQDANGVIQYNLAQQDMTAVRVTARFAFAVPNPITYDQATEASRWPFAVLQAP
jgi:HK97 family phage major capsid protein